MSVIEFVYDSQFSTEWLIKLAEVCEFGFEYGCANVDTFLQHPNKNCCSFNFKFFAPFPNLVSKMLIVKSQMAHGSWLQK